MCERYGCSLEFGMQFTSRQVDIGGGERVRGRGGAGRRGNGRRVEGRGGRRGEERGGEEKEGEGRGRKRFTIT